MVIVKAVGYGTGANQGHEENTQSEGRRREWAVEGDAEVLSGQPGLAQGRKG